MKRTIKLLSLLLILVFTFATVAIVAYAEDGEVKTQTLVDSQTVWRYLDDDTDPGAALANLSDWTLVDFDDSKWKSATGSFGSKGGKLDLVSGSGTPKTLIELYKPDGSGQVISTYYFRTDFEIENADWVTSISFSLHADDGLILYLNGSVILDTRSGTYDAAATTNKYYASMTAAAQSFTLTKEDLYGVLKDGKNVLSAELHNNQSSSSDIFFGMESAVATIEEVEEEIVINGIYQDMTDKVAQWKYLDDDTDPGANLTKLSDWALPTYDDSAWKSGVGAFGSKGGVIGSVSGCGTPKTLIELYKPDGSGQVISTYYFRTEFEIEDASKIQTLEFSLHADDGIVLYLNGYMIHDGRASIPESAATTNKYYISASAAEQTFTLNYKELRGIIKSGKNTLAVELHNNQSGSSDIYFGLDKFGAIVAVDKVEPTFDNIVLAVGSDESARGLSWYSLSSAAAELQYAPVSTDKSVFPSEYKTAAAVTKKSENKTGYYVSKATMTGLIENTDYVYRIFSDGKYSPLKYFSTDDSEEFEFIFVGDPQLSSEKHGALWQDTVDKIIDNFDAELLVSAGDQINTPASEDEYGYFIVDELASIAFAPTIGPPHDDPSIAFSEHFYTPNVSDKYGVTVSGANYWYRYGSALFMHLNMADGTALESEHKLFIEEAIAENPDASWKIVVLHKALYATGAHGDPDGRYFESEMSVIRPILAAQFSELGIDIAMGGHDHVYVRSHLMNGTERSDDEVYDNKVVNPTGVLHISAGSSTGTKYHDAYSDDVPFAAYQNDERRKSAIHFAVTEDSIVMTSYFLDDMSVFDTFTIERKVKEDGTLPSKATVSWYDTEGNLIKTNVGYEGFVADIPLDAYVPSGDGYRSVRITKWLDDSGNESNLIIGKDSSYSFYAAKEQPADGGYIGKISDAMLNLSYYSQFHMNLYLPILEGMERPVVSGASASYATAFISNREYWVYTWWMSAVSATDDKVITVSYTIDGVSYSQRVTVGGLVYAEIALEYATSQKERLAVANMLRYVRESKIYAGYADDQRFDALIGSLDGSIEGKVTLPDYPTAFTPLDTSLGELENYISKFYLSIGTSSNFVLVLNQKGIDAGLKNTDFTIYNESGVKINLFDYAGDGKTYQTNNMKVYDAIEKLTITLTLPKTDTEPSRKISGTYSLATYITEVEKTGENVEVAKALYAFGVAAADYKKQ